MRIPLLVSLAFLLAGCLSAEPEATPAPAKPADDSMQAWKAFVLDGNVTTFGRAHVATFYLSPGFLAPSNNNCIVLGTSGSTVRALNVTATWSGGEDLVLFNWVRSESDSSPRNHTHVSGPSPLKHTVPALYGGTWTIVGVQPPPDLPVGIELQETTVALHVEIQYAGEKAPRLDYYSGCNYDLS